MNPREKDLAIWEETCIEFIQRATSIEALHEVGLEIAESKLLIEAVKSEMEKIHAEYLNQKRKLHNAQNAIGD